MGIERSWEKASHAEMILWMVDGGSCNKVQMEAEWSQIQTVRRPESSVLLVINKQDQADIQIAWEACPQVRISAKEKQGLEALKTQLSSHFQEELQGQDTIVTNARHHEALGQALQSLQEVQRGMSAQLTSDLLAIDIRNTLYHLASITGAVSADDILHSIFSKFCIGK
jgi:tRNA modification GTPase